ncbi:pro-sigmaK processing inhibitor BofA family protein [uncultured Helcococcus sp.]|uniref:pro-sigmaK processing inhibitor BofA family protein n=1 Tax=uncultured Helcococcus sp. TaxID=1072508 RepID=UPI002637A61B|nr:pro-sigmaK processing inhibitor BofA family protein [uncultured Helcococcus sp.]
MSIVLGIIALLFLYIVLKILRVSMSVIIKLLWNGVIGLVLLVIFNALGSIFGLNIEVNALNAIVAGLLGVPGIVLLLILN